MDEKNIAQKENELIVREAALDAREKELTQREEKAKYRMRDNLYDKIPVSVKTMDKIIIFLALALVVCLVIGFLN